jgi:mannosyl-3-phosphoglycerate phosphatase
MYRVFSDLDGTLLDHNTYSHAAAQEGIDLLRERSVPLVLVSSKTLPEMTELHGMLGLGSPFVFENGGGIAWPDETKTGEPLRVEILGLPISELREKFHVLDTVIPVPMKSILDMSVEEVMERTGLPQKRAILARERRSSIPFILMGKYDIDLLELESINMKLRGQGLGITRGGRFFHLISPGSTKGGAVKNIIASYADLHKNETIISMGVGDSENDISMLKEVDRPFVVRKHDGSIIQTGLPDVLVTKNIGPAGFSEAVKSLWTW